MPDQNTTDTVVPTDIGSIKAAAQNAYAQSVARALTKKYTTMASNQSVIDAFVAAHNKRVADFEAALASATTPAQMLEAIETFNFPAPQLGYKYDLR
jgi:hypothetical protein